MSKKCHVAHRAWRACTPRTGTVLIDSGSWEPVIDVSRVDDFEDSPRERGENEASNTEAVYLCGSRRIYTQRVRQDC